MMDTKDEETEKLKKYRGPTKPVPPKDIRIDCVGHDDKRCSSKNRCKLTDCKGLSRTDCFVSQLLCCASFINNTKIPLLISDIKT